MQNWEHFHHVADVGVRGFGDTMAAAFEQAAVAMTAVVAEPGAVRAAEWVEVACEAPNPEILLADWLNALVFEMATRNMLFARFAVRIETPIEDPIENWRLDAKAWGEAVDVARHQPAAEVKGATLSELEVARGDDGRWRAQCIVDV